VGDTWTYRVLNQIDGRERQLVIRVVAIRGEEVHHASGSITDPSGNFTRIVRNAERVENYSPSSNNYLFPLQTGATSLLKSVQQTGERTYDLNIELKVAGEEEVQVGAGKMRTLRIERVTKWKQRNSKNAGVNILTHWYSSAVKRPVLSEQLQTTSEGKVLLNERMELTAYAVK
jgi:hypothetical protein